MDSIPHPAASLPESLRFQYVAVLVAVVYADGSADVREISLVRRLCDALDLAPSARETIEAATRAPNPIMVKQTVRLLGAIGDKLRFALMTDAIAFSFVDGRVTSSEITQLWSFADSLEISRDSVLALARWVEGVLVESPDGAPRLSRALESGLDGLPLDPSTAAAAVRWLDETLRRTT